MVKYCNFAGIGMIPYFALGAGKLARPLGSDTTARSQGLSRMMPWFANPEESENEIRRRVEKVAKDKGWTMTQVSLAWLNARVTSPLVGVTTVRPGLGLFSACVLRDNLVLGGTSGRGHHPRLHAHGGREQVSRGAVSARTPLTVDIC
jgi:hypothetical protein